MNYLSSEYAKLIPAGLGLGVLVYYAVKGFQASGAKCCGTCHLNPNIQKDKEKVATMLNIEDLGDKAALCRCWRSAKFPYCDGSHAKHNKETGDNVGPAVITKSK